MEMFILFLPNSTPMFLDWLHISHEIDSTQTCSDFAWLWTMLKSLDRISQASPTPIFCGPQATWNTVMELR